MKRITFISVTLFLTSVLFLSGYNDPGNESVYIVPEDCLFDFSGTWSFTTSNHQVTGMCPAGTDTEGKCKVIQEGHNIKLEFLSGMTCNPVSMCEYTGSCEGNTYTFINSSIVDNEGGKVTNTITITVNSKKTATGKAISTYSISGVNCEWTFDISLVKEE